MKLPVITGFLCLLLMPLLAFGQDEEASAGPAFLAASYFECDQNDMWPMAQDMDSVALPIYEELVSEGALGGWGTLWHDWAGYDNVIVWSVANSIQALADGNDAFWGRMAEKHPDYQWGSDCAVHTDAIYRMGPSSGAPKATDSTEVLSFYQCDFNKMGDVWAMADSMMKPVWDELVAEGYFGQFGMVFHEWAGKENVIMYRAAQNKKAFLDGHDEFIRRMEERYGEQEGPTLADMCPQHRDGIYWIGPRTMPAGE
jgi:hypothetical protein